MLKYLKLVECLVLVCKKTNKQVLNEQKVSIMTTMNDYQRNRKRGDPDLTADENNTLGSTDHQNITS